MAKPASYPFMNIAKKYGLDYGDVLLYTEIHRHQLETLSERQIEAIDNVSAIEPEYAACIDIAEACDNFRAIQTGVIHWETGDPSRHENGMLKSIPMTIEDEPGEHAEIIHALDYRNHEEE